MFGAIADTPEKTRQNTQQESRLQHKADESEICHKLKVGIVHCRRPFGLMDGIVGNQPACIPNASAHQHLFQIPAPEIKEIPPDIGPV